MTFQDLNLHEEILKAVEKAGYAIPTPIQYKSIPKILGGFDLCASAQTGTGKTAAFILPALQRLLKPSAKAGIGPRILILVPTRELATQVAAEAVKYSQDLKRIKTVCIYGGAPYPIQNRQLSRPYEILVATPGRLIDHMNSGRIDLSRIEMFILDEADRMLDMGFIKPVEHIAAALPKIRQTLLFSATLGKNVLKLAENLMNKPMVLNASSEKAKHENIEQRLHYVNDIHDKNRVLDFILNDVEANQIIVFTSTKRQAGVLMNDLAESGYPVAALHGDMDQRQRNRTINAMRQGEKRILIATDVAARGIDIQTITHVINYDLPANAEDYVHRIGRTGRASAKGISLSFATFKESYLIKKFEQFTGQKMSLQTIPGLEIKPKQNQWPRHNQQPKFKKRHLTAQR